MDKNVILVGVGGFAGSICRYLVSIFAATHISPTFPFGTMIANLGGCFLIGAVMSFSERFGAVTPEVRILLTTGFCGGFTTFSTFSYESLELIREGEFVPFAVNVLVSLILGLVATYLGMQSARML
ncbi:MAG: fluoride efflux transporter CrcB [Blastocatellia bacterium]